MRLYYLDKSGWPVELVKGRWFLNFLRILIHTRKITFKKPGRDTSIEGFHKLVDKLGTLSAEEVKDFMEDLEEYRQAYAAGCTCTQESRLLKPNALTQETLEKTDRGEDVESFDTVEELFEDLNN